MVDFTEAGELGVFIDEEQLAALEERMSEKGYLEGADMATTFNMLRANDLIWSFVVNNYLLGKDPFPFDLLYWNSDSTRMPAAMHSFYLRAMYQENKLSAGEITRLLEAWKGGDAGAQHRLFPIVYEALRKRAAGQLRHERSGLTLRPTDLVHETYLRLCAQNAGWKNREHFFAVAARLMRRVIVDRARARKAQKRGRGIKVTLGEASAAVETNADVLEVDRALDELAAADERMARLVELRFFGGLPIEEAAAVLGVSVATANRDWALAKAWLYRRLKSAR